MHGRVWCSGTCHPHPSPVSAPRSDYPEGAKQMERGEWRDFPPTCLGVWWVLWEAGGLLRPGGTLRVSQQWAQTVHDAVVVPGDHRDHRGGGGWAGQGGTQAGPGSWIPTGPKEDGNVKALLSYSKAINFERLSFHLSRMTQQARPTWRAAQMTATQTGWRPASCYPWLMSGQPASCWWSNKNCGHSNGAESDP